MAWSPQTPENSEAFKQERKLDFDILPDPGNALADAFGLRFELPDYLREIYKSFEIDLAQFNGDDSWTLPMPARYIVDKDGVIRYARVNADYTVRPEPSETLEALRALNSA